MNWVKQSMEDWKISGIIAFTIIMLLFSLTTHLKFVSTIALIILILIYANKLYFKKIGYHLFFENIIQKNHFFINQNGEWILSFQNDGLPILGGKLKVYFDQVVTPSKGNSNSQLFLHEFSVPFSILKGQKKEFHIPFETKARGVARIQKLEILVPSLLGIGEVILEYKSAIHQDVVVFPNPIPIQGLKDLSTRREGNQMGFNSLFVNQLAPMGSRDYVLTDNFNQIHWKASARKQTLQTKIFETISEKGWMISINISDGYGLTGNLEQFLSGIAEFAYFAYREQIPYSLCINIRTFGQTPFFYIPLGEGKMHFQKILEGLSTVNPQHFGFPYEKMLSYYTQHLSQQPVFLHAGVKTLEVNVLLTGLVTRGVTVLELDVKEKGGHILPFLFNKRKVGER